MGGEKYLLLSLVLFLQGSPPHGRGKALLRSVANVAMWITPAWAGKSVRSSGFATRCRDHPRMGGEKSIELQLLVFCSGSPPHGRGKVPPIS